MAFPPLKSQIRVLLVAAALMSAAPTRLSAMGNSPQITIELATEVKLEPDRKLPSLISGHMTIWDWSPKGDQCIYLPYSDKNYGAGRVLIRRLEALTGKYSKVVYIGGKASISSPIPSLTIEELSPHLFRLKNSDPKKSLPISLDYEAKLPRLPLSDNSFWFYERFHPQLLEECPDESVESPYYQTETNIQWKATIQYPEGFEYAGHEEARPSARRVFYTSRGKDLAFALAPKFNRLELKTPVTDVIIYYQSKDFPELLQTIRESLISHAKWFGDFPHQKLIIIETKELEPQGLPGILTFNRPKQAIFDSIQTQWLNWRHWILNGLIARQWLGSDVIAKTPDDHWLLEGIVEFATLEALQNYSSRFNLFNSYDLDFPFLSFNYLQLQEVTAAMLQRYSPYETLTSKDHDTILPANKQSNNVFIKQSFAMRQLKFLAGEQNFAKFLQTFIKENSFQRVTPKEFFQRLGSLPSPFQPAKRRELSQQLDIWWTKKGWPDLVLDSFTSEKLADGKWLNKVEISQKGDFALQSEVAFQGEGGEVQTALTERKDESGKQWIAMSITDFEPENVTIDPSHSVFDQDRFNNTSRWPRLKFFPGSAKTLSDDDFTIFWAPYAMRRSGEPFTLGVQGAFFKYISSDLAFKIEGSPSTKQGAYQLRHRHTWELLALSGDFSLSHNFQNFRFAEYRLTRKPLFLTGPSLSVSGVTRFRDEVGRKETAHQTLGGQVLLSPDKFSGCDLRLGADIEVAPKALATGFSYVREQLVATSECGIANTFDLQLRGFRGRLIADGNPPTMAFFDPQNANEVSLRVDFGRLSYAKEVVSGRIDLLFPLIIPLPGDILVLNRQLKWLIFQDYGYALDLKAHYKDAGLGIIMPFGGDLMGAGPLAITRLSFLTVLISEAEGIVSKRPKFLFSLAGEL